MPQHCSAFICPSPNGLPSRHIHFLRKQPLNVTGIPKDDFHLTCCCCINQRYPVASITTGQEAGSRFSQNWFVIFLVFFPQSHEGEVKKKKSSLCRRKPRGVARLWMRLVCPCLRPWEWMRTAAGQTTVTDFSLMAPVKQNEQEESHLKGWPFRRSPELSE